MYGAFYGFSVMPFGVTPDTRFFFPSSRHTEALAKISRDCSACHMADDKGRRPELGVLDHRAHLRGALCGAVLLALSAVAHARRVAAASR